MSEQPIQTSYEASLTFEREEGDPFDWDAFFNTVREKATEYLGSPRRELLFRLNERLQGRDPGEPFNWRGLR